MFLKLEFFWDVALCSLIGVSFTALMSTSETLAHSNEITWRYIPED
jgi:hypothetical protein